MKRIETLIYIEKWCLIAVINMVDYIVGFLLTLFILLLFWWININSPFTFNLFQSWFFGITEFSHCWITFIEHSYPTFSFTFFIEILHLCRIGLWCFLVYHVFLRVIMTSLTPGKITGYFLWHWYESGTSSFITCKKALITLSYVDKKQTW
jgi:hypothetical protein